MEWRIGAPQEFVDPNMEAKVECGNMGGTRRSARTLPTQRTRCGSVDAAARAPGRASPDRSLGSPSFGCVDVVIRLTYRTAECDGAGARIWKRTKRSPITLRFHMGQFSFSTLDVFTEERFQGNPLAVVANADGLSAAEMQRIAAEFNLSETAFLLTPRRPEHAAWVRIFHRTAELPFAGHPSVGAAFVLARLPQHRDSTTLILEEQAGPVEVQILRNERNEPRGARIAAPQPLALGPELPAEMVAACAGLEAADIVTQRHPPLRISMGNSYYAAEVTPEALTRARPDIIAFREAVRQRPELAARYSLHLYARETQHVRARMFSPLAGTFEDPATGSANVALGGLLLSLTTEAEADMVIVQGVEMGRPSRLEVSSRRAAEGIIGWVGGSCVAVMSGELTV